MSMTKAVVYYYFKSKETLLQAIIERCSELTSTAIERGVAEGDTPVEKLALTSFHFASMILGNQKMIALYFREERYFPEALRARLLEAERSEERRVGEECVSTCRSGGSP